VNNLRCLLFYIYFSLYGKASENHDLVIILFSDPHLCIISTNTDFDYHSIKCHDSADSTSDKTERQTYVSSKSSKGFSHCNEIFDNYKIGTKIASDNYRIRIKETKLFHSFPLCIFCCIQEHDLL
jgi:hypothetical protein